MKRFLFILLALVIVVAGASALLLNDANIQRFTEDWLSEKMARRIQVDGEFSVEWGNPLRVTAESVRLANPDWADNPIMATAARVEAAIDLTTITGDEPLILSELVIEELDGELVSNEGGENNWTFGDPDSDSEANFLIQNLEVTQAKLNVRRYALQAVDFEIDSLRQVQNDEGLLQTSLVGRYNERPVSANGQLGPFRNLLAGENVRIALSARFGTLEIEGAGIIDDLDDPRRPKLTLTVQAPDAGEVASMFGFEVASSSNVDLQFAVEPVDQGVKLDAGGRWGGTNLDIKGSVRDLPNLDGLDLKASGNGEELSSALRLFGVRGMPEVPYEFVGDLSRDGEQLDIRELRATVGNFVVELTGDANRFPSLNDANLQLEVRGDDVARFRELFGIPGVAEGEFYLDASLGRSPEGLDAFEVNAQTALGKGRMTGTLGSAPGYVGSKASIRADGLSLGRLSNVFLVRGLRDQPFGVAVEVEVVPDGYQLKEGTSFNSGDTVIRATGLLGPDPLAQDTRLDWSLSNVDLAELGVVALDTQNLPSRQINATGATQVRPNDFVLSDVKGTIGQAEFQLAGQLGRAANYRGTDLRGWFRGPELERLAFLLGDVNLPDGPFQVSGRVQRTPDGIRVSESMVDVAGAEGRIDGEFKLPAATLMGEFDIELAGPDTSAFWEGRYGVAFGKQPFAVDLRGELTDDLLQLEDGELRIGQAEITATGVIRRARDSGTLKIRATSPEIARLGTIAGIEILPGRRLDLSTTVARNGDVFELQNFFARTNNGDLAGNLTYTLGDPPSLKGELTSTLFDISWITDPVREEVLEDKPKREAEARADGRLIPDWELPLEFLKRWNVDLSIAADEILRERRDVKNWYVRILLQDGALAIAPWRFGGNSGSLIADMHLTPSANGADVRVNLQAQDLVTGIWQPDNEDLSMLPKGDWDINLTSRGSTVRELFANLNGTAKLSSKAGRLENAQTRSALFGDLLGNIVSSVNPFTEREPYTEITCAVFPFTFGNGVMESAPSVVVQTDKLNIISRGQINLRTERLDLSFNSKPRRGLGVSAGSIVNPFVRIGGTMAEPAVTLNTTGAALTTGAAFFTAGLSIIAKAAFDAAWRSPDPCGRVLEEAEKRFAKKNGK